MNNEPTINESIDTSDTSPAPSRTRRLAIAGVAVGVLGGAAVGLLATMPNATNAASPETTVAASSTTNPAKPVTDDVAAPTDAERVTKRTEMIRAQLQPLVDDGTITAEQADTVAATLAANAPAGHPDGPRGPGGRMGPMSDELAQVLGLDDATALREQLQAGNSLADIAEANGKSVDAVKTFLRSEAETRLADAVEAGKLTQDEADAKLADLDTHIDAMINGELPAGGRGFKPPAPPTDDTNSSDVTESSTDA